jgi:lysophospholipase L1-like esterase
MKLISRCLAMFSRWVAQLSAIAPNRNKRWFLMAVGLAIALAALPSVPTAFTKDEDKERWVGTWATGPAGPTPPEAFFPAPEFNNQTLRLIVHTSIGGDEVRVRISNTFGTAPLVIGAARVALRRSGASIVPETDRALTFSRQSSITVPAEALVLSDPVKLHVPPLSDLVVSIYLPNATVATTVHLLALQTNYVSTAGDFTGATDLPTASTITYWPFLTGVDVRGSQRAGAIITLGDSITDGANSTLDTNRRWPDLLAKRLQAQRDLDHLGVLNEGIIGNRILHPTESQFGLVFGPAGLARFDRDVLAQAGVQYVIVLLGINDIGHPGSAAPLSEEVSAEEIIAGYRQFIARAHEKGLTIFGATLLPFEGTTIEGFYSPEKEVKRQAVNQWIRTSGEFDGVIDFDKAVRDPTHPTRLMPRYDGGDHLHPSDAGHKAMAEAIRLRLFREGGARDD